MCGVGMCVWSFALYRESGAVFGVGLCVGSLGLWGVWGSWEAQAGTAMAIYRSFV